MCVSFPVFGSNIWRCRKERLTGKTCADGCDEPARQNAGLSGGATAEVIREEDDYSGIRVTLDGNLSRATVRLHVE